MPNKHYLSQVIKVISTVISQADSMHPWYNVMKMALYFYVLPPHLYNSSALMRKSLDKSQMRDILKNTWPVLLKTVKAFENKV